MSTLMPEIELQLADAAERLARGPGGVRRRRWRMGTLLVIGLLATGGVGYAARDIWRPVLGGTSDHTPVAVGSAPDPRLLAAFAPLRREQTGADRGRGAQYALQFATNRRGVRTEFVRQLGTTPSGQPIILVPVTNATPTSPDADGSGDSLCLWVQDKQSDGGGRGCRSTEQVLAGGLGSMMGNPIESAEQRALEKDLAAARRKAFAEAKGKGTDGQGITIRLPADLMARQAALGDRMHLVGFVPDDVVRVTVGRGRGAQAIPVRDNLFQTDIDVAGPGRLEITWFDAQGRGRPGGLP